MSLSVGLVGMPLLASPLCSMLCQMLAEAANYPFCTIDKNVGVVEVPDDSLLRMRDALQPKECVASTIQIH